MAFTNRTTNYGLPQWVANDKPTWLSDVNGAFETIDTNLKTVADSSSGLGEDIALLQETQNQQGQSITNMRADVTTNTNNISVLQAKDTQLETAISGVETIATANTNKIGDTPLTTVAQTLTGAIEEIKNQPINNYSYDEIVVGKWVDGKTIYRKVVDFGQLPNATTKLVAHNIANVDKFVSITGIAYASAVGIFVPLPLVYSGSDYLYNTEFTADRTNIRIVCARNKSDLQAVIILEYTKN